jgi:nitronate monooxygenase
MQTLLRNSLLEKLGIENPVIQGPMGGGPSTLELVAAVSNAGGLGSLGAAYLKPDEIAAAIRKVQSLTRRPFGVNLFAGDYTTKPLPDPKPMLEILGEIHERFGLAAPVVPQLPPDPFPAQLEAVLDSGAPIFSFTFGIPDADSLARLKKQHITIMGTATTVAEAKLLAAAGVDAIVAQGAEAGAHRGTFAGPFEKSLVPTLELVPAIRAGVSSPVIASGGLMDGHDIRVALRLGASAAALGTAFLVSPESGAAAVHKQAILAAKSDTTSITRTFSGRPARGLTNTFMEKLAGREDIILPYPLQNMLTRAMRTAAATRGDAEFLSLWAGTGVTRSRQLPAAGLVQRLVAEFDTEAEGGHVFAT